MFHKSLLGKFFLYLSAISFLIPFASFGLGRAITTTSLGTAIIAALLGGDIKGALCYLRKNKFIIPMILLPLMMYIGVTYTPSELQKEALNIAGKYLWLIYPLLLTPMLITKFNQKNWQITAYHFFILGGIIVSLIGLFSFLSPSFFKWLAHMAPAQGYDLTSPLQSHTETGFITALAAFFSAHLFKYYSNKKLKIVYAISFLFISYYVLFLNTSKTGVLLYGLLALLFVLQYFYKNWKMLIAAIICLVILFFAISHFSKSTDSRINTLTSSIQTVDSNAKDTSFGQRSIMVKLALEQYQKHPIIGSGTGSYISGSWVDPNNPKAITTDPHSEYLFILTKTGTIGLTLLVLYFLFMIYDSLFVLRKGLEANLALGTSLSFVFYAFIESILYHNPASYEVAFFVSLFFLSNLKKPKITA